jgi:hypothetical protein
MGKRRDNHGRASTAGSLALRAVGAIVPPDRLRLTRIQIAWPEIAPGRLQRVAWPVVVGGGTLTVNVIDNQWLHELLYMKLELLERIQQRCRAAEIDGLRMRVGEVPEPWPEPEPLPDPVVASLPDEPARDTVAALNDVEDPRLRQAMANARMALSHRLRR